MAGFVSGSLGAKVPANDELQELGLRIRVDRKSKIDDPVGGSGYEHCSKVDPGTVQNTRNSQIPVTQTEEGLVT